MGGTGIDGGSTATITVGGDLSISCYDYCISVGESLDITVAGSAAFEMYNKINGTQVNLNSTAISELSIKGWVYTEYDVQNNTPKVTTEYDGEIICTYYEDADCEKAVDNITTAQAGTYYVKAAIASSTDDSNNVTIGTYTVEEFEILTKYYTVVIDDVEEKVEHGTVIEVPTKEGYTFDGWVDEDEEVYTSEITVTSNLNLSTTWTKDVVDSTDGDGDTNADADTGLDSDTDLDANTDTDTDTDDVVDTGDTNNVLLFTSLSIGALALVLIDIKKRNRV